MKPMLFTVPGHTLRFSVIRLLTWFFLVLMVWGCRGPRGDKEPDPAFSKYVTSFTSGVVSVEAPVVVQLSEVPPGMQPGQVLPEEVFRLEPPAPGEVVAGTGGLVQFRPKEPLKRDTRYRVTFDLGRLMEVDASFRRFRFGFSTLAQDFTLEEEGLQAGPALGFRGFSHAGKVTTADVEDPLRVEALVNATFDGHKIPLRWIHAPDRKTHTFMADSLMRHDTSPRELLLEWDGKPLGVKKKGSLTLAIPAAGEFTVLAARAHTSPEQRVEVVFSDPLSTADSPEGWVTLGDNLPFTWQVDGNHLLLWPAGKITGESRLSLYRGLRSAEGKALPETLEFPLFFKNLKPEVRLLGKGVIVPEEGVLSLPFEAVSLSAIDLRIIKIYASNMRQFLQDNQVDGGSDLMSVGRLVYSGRVPLESANPEQLHRWNTYKIDLNRFLTPEQGALYRVELRFRRAYALTDCGEPLPAAEMEEETTENWDAPDWYSLYHWPRDFDWDEKDNPCHNSYYNSERFVWRNIFASDLGIIAKEGSGFRYTFVVSSLRTALPLDETEITVYDLQHQLLGKSHTGATGMATLTLPRKPFVAVARKGTQTGYLRLDDASSLSLSNFDVSGAEVVDGIKGFLYGERGVWRPGDQIFLTFILDDPGKRLPAGAPVVFRLINARGQEVEKRVATAGENGFYHFPVATRPDDPTGNWYARVQVGGATFEKRLKVEMVKPNRLKIDLGLPPLLTAGRETRASLSAAWLHGTLASSMRAVVEAEMFPMKTTFRGYEKFSFDDPGAVWFPTKSVVFEGALNEAGKTEIPLRFPEKGAAPGKMRVWFTTRVFEEGGDFSIRVQETEYSPYARYLGLRMPEEEDGWYQTGKVYQPELVALSPEGRPLPLGRVEVSLYKIDWRWWWESGEDHLAHYVSGRHYKPVRSWSLNSAALREQLELKVDYSDWRDNGRYLLYARDPESGHGTGITFYMSEWGDWRTDAMPDGATMLALRTDKEKYAPGEKIKVTLPSVAGARALVSLEDGRQVREIFWVKTTDQETSFEVEVKPGMAPTLYLHVTLLQPYGSTRNDAPIRLYGVRAVAVEDPSTLLEPVITADPELRPEKEFTLTVREKTGRGMTYTVAIVDEGLLDLTGFRTPDPHAHFYAREALGVKSYDLYDYVAGAYGAQLEKAFAVGGDQEMRAAGHRQANRFSPVVLFAGPFTLRSGSRGHTFRMPNYVGAVRAMVVAGQDGAYGTAEKSLPVRTAVMVLATLPRVAGPGEEISLAAEIFALRENAHEVTVRVETSDLLTPVGVKSRMLTFARPGEQTTWFKLKAAPATGTATVKVTATAGGESAVALVTLDIRNPHPAVTTEKSALLEAGASRQESLPLPGMAGTNEAYLELSAIPGMNLSRHLHTLTRYPHGCAEQITSVAFGQLFLEDLLELKATEKEAAAAHVREALLKLRGFQSGQGGFATWPGQNSADLWTTSYAGHFMLMAAQKGYAVPPEMKSRWIAFQQARAREWRVPAVAEEPIRRQEALIQAYRLYTLALARTPETGVMNRFREEVTSWPEARWRLAAAYLLAGQPAAAGQLLARLTPTAENPVGPNLTFGSQLRDKAMILETLLLQNERTAAFALVREMAEEIGRSEWLSTQTAAWSFYALARYFGSRPGGGGLDAVVTSGGKKQTVKSGLPLVRWPLPAEGTGEVTALVTNQGREPLYMRLAARGIPLEDRTGEQQNSLRITHLFLGRDGKPTDPAALPQGSDLTLVVTVTHPGIRGPYHNLALTTIFPSGWEILHGRVFDLPAGTSPGYDYQDVRDDRVYTYFSLRTGESKTFRFSLNAAYEGRFYLPALLCEAMYDHSVYARQPGGWVSVVRK